MFTQWLQFRQDGTQEIYFRVLSKTTPTTILVAVIKAHRNGKTHLNAKTNPNPHLQKTCRKKFLKTLKNYSRHGIRTRDSWLNKHNTNTVPLSQQGTIDPVVIFGLLTYIGKKKNAIKNKTNTVPNPTTNTNPNPTIDEEKERKWNKVA